MVSAKLELHFVVIFLFISGVVAATSDATLREFLCGGVERCEFILRFVCMLTYCNIEQHTRRSDYFIHI